MSTYVTTANLTTSDTCWLLHLNYKVKKQLKVIMPLYFRFSGFAILCYLFLR